MSTVGDCVAYLVLGLVCGFVAGLTSRSVVEEEKNMILQDNIDRVIVSYNVLYRKLMINGIEIPVEEKSER